MLSSTVIRTYVLFWYKFRENWLKKKNIENFAMNLSFYNSCWQTGKSVGGSNVH